jgi:peptide chain release factor 2
MSYGGYFDIDSKILKIEELEVETNSLNFWNDQKKANETFEVINSNKKIVDNLRNYKDSLLSFEEEINKLKISLDIEMQELIEKEVESLENKINEFEILTLLNGDYDKNNCILEIHSGAGGTESCDWANMLYRMYIRWCEKNGYKYEELDIQEGEEVGIKGVSILIKGVYAYGYLKGEKGVHRLIRISPFDSNSRRHTSFASVDIIPEFDDNINVEIKEEDIKIDVYRSSGAGGQSVNTTDSAVRITHLPTKIVVTCQNERSQLKNKERAMHVLKNKIYLHEIEKKEEEISKLKGNPMDINFGSQIRSYVMHPYSMVKDHRTDAETSNVLSVLDGNIDMFIESYLKGDIK